MGSKPIPVRFMASFMLSALGCVVWRWLGMEGWAPGWSLWMMGVLAGVLVGAVGREWDWARLAGSALVGLFVVGSFIYWVPG
jgi:hypothetical protein